MGNWFQSLSLIETTAIMAFASLLVVFALSRLLRGGTLWIAAFVVPFALAWCVYWMMASDVVEAQAWERLFLVAWGGTGTLACVILVACLRLRWRRAQ